MTQKQKKIDKEITVDEFVDKLWTLTDEALEENSMLEVIGMLSFVKESWLDQLFKAIDQQDFENDSEVMFG